MDLTKKDRKSGLLTGALPRFSSLFTPICSIDNVTASFNS